MIRILTNDGLENDAIKALEKAGIEVVNDHIEQDKLGEALKEFDAVVIRSATKLTKEVIEAEKGGKLKLIVRAGVGVDNMELLLRIHLMQSLIQ